MLALAALAVTVGGWNRRAGSPRWMQLAPWVLPAATLLTAAPAVWSHSELGVASTIVLLALTAIDWVRREPAIRTGVPQGGVP